MSAPQALPEAILAALTTLADLKAKLEAPVAVTDAPHLQTAVNAALNASVERLRGVESAAQSFPGTVDAEIVEFVSGTTTSHPDILLQNRLQEALDAKTAADTRRDALTSFAALLETKAPR